MKYQIVGLGNPGEKYEGMRHNAGWIVMDEIFPDAIWERNSYANAGVAKIAFGDQEVLLVKPATFMNESGTAVRYFIEKEEITPENTIVIYDDIDLPLGKIKISFDRGSGGHNGIKSIEANLGSRQFVRIRIGISKVLESGEFVKPNVLGNFEETEKDQVKEISKVVKSALETIIKEGRELAMTRFNG